MVAGVIVRVQPGDFSRLGTSGQLNARANCASGPHDPSRSGHRPPDFRCAIARRVYRRSYPHGGNIPYREVPQRWPELAEFTDEMVVYCEVGIRAAIAERILEQTGFQQIVTLAGDMRGWRAAGLPLSPPVPGQDTINSIKKLSK